MRKAIVTVFAVMLCGALVTTGFRRSAATAEPKAKTKPKPKTVRLFDGKTLAGWRVPKKFSFEKHGRVSVKNGAIILEAGQPATGIAWNRREKPPTYDYEIELEAKRLEGRDFFCGLTVPIGKSHLTLICGGWGGETTGISNIDTFSAVENDTTDVVEFKNGKWYKIRLRVTRENISAWIDGKQIVDHAVKGHKFGIWWEQEPARPLGIVTWKTKAAVRKITLTYLQPQK